jgi:hypothetical protein
MAFCLAGEDVGTLVGKVGNKGGGVCVGV